MATGAARARVAAVRGSGHHEPVSPNATQVAGAAARAALGLSCAFLGLLALLHALKPELDPSWRMISEYAIGRFGWLMSLAFFCWGGAVLALSIDLGPALRSGAGRVGRVWLVALAAALVGAGIFETDPITDPRGGAADQLHRSCGALVILTTPLAASLVARGLRASEGSVEPRLVWATRLTWLGLVGFLGSIALSRGLHPEAGRAGPEILMGWPNRVMVVLYHGWLIAAALRRSPTRTEAPGARGRERGV